MTLWHSTPSLQHLVIVIIVKGEHTSQAYTYTTVWVYTVVIVHNYCWLALISHMTTTIPTHSTLPSLMSNNILRCLWITHALIISPNCQIWWTLPIAVFNLSSFFIVNIWYDMTLISVMWLLLVMLLIITHYRVILSREDIVHPELLLPLLLIWVRMLGLLSHNTLLLRLHRLLKWLG